MCPVEMDSKQKARARCCHSLCPGLTAFLCKFVSSKATTCKSYTTC